jgi:alpha-L-fucosidase
MKANGTVIHGSRPWVTPVTETTEGTPVRFVQKDGEVYAVLLGLPGARTFGLRGVDGRSVDAAHIVGSRAKVGIGERDGMVEITLPERMPVEPAYSLRLGSGARWNG